MTQRPESEADVDKQLQTMRERLDEVQREIADAERDADEVDPARRGRKFIDEEGPGNPPG